MLILYVGASNIIELQQLKNSVTGAYDNGATVTLTTIKDAAGANVTGETFPKTLAKVGGDTTGLYRATLAYGIALTAGKRYTAVIDITGSSGERDHREIPIDARYRQKT